MPPAGPGRSYASCPTRSRRRCWILPRRCEAVGPADLAAPERAISKALADGAIGADPVLAAALAIRQSEILLCCGQPTEARRTLETGAWADANKPALLVAYRDILLARIETALGRAAGGAAARAGLSRHPVRTGGGDTDCGCLPGARRPAQRAELCAPGARRDGWIGHPGRARRGDAFDAQIAQRSDDQARALEMLARALAVANDDIVLPFNQVADVFAPLLSRHPTVAALWPTQLADLSSVVSVAAMPGGRGICRSHSPTANGPCCVSSLRTCRRLRFPTSSACRSIP